MIKNLPEWYRVAQLVSVPEEKLESRSKVITSIIDSKDIDWLLECVRLYLNKPLNTEDFENEFIKLFTEDDPMFLQKDNELELRVLSGAIINEFVVGDEFEDSITLALSLISATFKNAEIINSDIIDNVRKYIVDKSLEVREQDLELDLEEEEEQDEVEKEEDIEKRLENKMNNFYNIPQINKLLKKLSYKISILEEESNIHWWIFRGYSNYKNEPFKDLDIEVVPIVLGKELSDLTKLVPGFYAFDQFLMKVIYDSFSENGDTLVAFKDVINKIEKADKVKFIEKFKKTEIKNICPLMFAFHEALKIDDNKTWIKYYESSTGIKTNMKLNIIDLARQAYTENLLLKCF